MRNITSIPITFSVQDEVSNNDTRFIRCTVDVLHTGTNFNNSVFTKEVVEQNLDTIKNTPILGFISEMPDGEYVFKGHECIISKDEKGVRRKNIGSVYGVIPESCNPRWFTKTLDSGEEVEMLQVDALLWAKLEDSVDIMMRDIEKAQSMELCPDNIEGYEDISTGLFHFTKFSFDGCTILGQGIDPAMQDANITINEVQFTMSDFVKNIQSELNDKFTTFTKMVNEKTNQGGIEAMSKTDFTQTVLQQFEDISTMVREHETIRDRWGDSVPRYYAVDVQENEVIVVDRESGYNYFGFAFTINGDKPEIDFASGKRKKLRYEDYVEGTTLPEGGFDFGNHGIPIFIFPDYTEFTFLIQSCHIRKTIIHFTLVNTVNSNSEFIFFSVFLQIVFGIISMNNHSHRHKQLNNNRDNEYRKHNFFTHLCHLRSTVPVDSF